MEALYGSKRRGGREKTAAYAWTQPTDRKNVRVFLVSYYSVSTALRFANCGGDTSCCVPVDKVDGFPGEGFLETTRCVKAQEHLTFNYGAKFWDGQQPVYNHPVPAADDGAAEEGGVVAGGGANTDPSGGTKRNCCLSTAPVCDSPLTFPSR